MTYFQNHLSRVYAMMEIDPDIAEARAVLKWIRRERRQEFPPGKPTRTCAVKADS